MDNGGSGFGLAKEQSGFKDNGSYGTLHNGEILTSVAFGTL
jgi:hypothetical protein